MKITAAAVDSKGAPFVLQELELGELRSDEVLVKVAASGICHTDLICRDQWIPVPLPAVLGHEGAGIVEEVGSGVTRVASGDRVAMTYNCCGACPACSRSLGVYCDTFVEHNFAASRPADGSSVLSRNGELIHGHFFGQSSFATYAVARENNVVKIDESIPFEIVAPFGCDIQTGAGSVRKRASAADRQQLRRVRRRRSRDRSRDGRAHRRLHDDRRRRRAQQSARASPRARCNARRECV